MGITVIAPKQDGNARFNSLKVNLTSSILATRAVLVDDDGNFFASGSFSGGVGTGTVTNVSVATANGFAGDVATPTTTPAITIKTTVTGLLKGDGTAVSAATAGTDYISSTVGTASWSQNSVTSSYAETSSLPLRGIITASAVLSTITFRKGDNTTFDITLASDVATSADKVKINNTNTGVWYPTFVTQGENTQSITVNSSSFAYSASINTLYVSTSYAYTASIATSASYAATASIATSASYAATASIATSAISSSYPISITGSTLYSVSPATSLLSPNNVIALGNFAGGQSSLAIHGVFLGYQAGYQAYTASNSIFIGQLAGTSAEKANNSNFLGNLAGYLALTANNSNFFGANAGQSATAASNSNFFGATTGQFAAAANNSNFLGLRAGYQATSASNSNFFGQDSGYQTTFANDSNFIGSAAGLQSTSASYSNFIGYQSGYQATSASYSNFIGYKSGFKAISASYSILIGYKAGNNIIPTTGIGSNNIIIGTNITLADNTSNAINIGGIIFGSGSYSQTLTNTFSGSANGKIGINNANPTETLDISGSLRATGSIYFPGIVSSSYPYLLSVDTSSGKLYYTNQFTGSLFGTSSWAHSASVATSASYAPNLGVTQIIAGTPNITLSPTNGIGQVTISSTGTGGTNYNTMTGSYGSFYSTQTQTIAVINTAYSMSFNITDITNGVAISGSQNTKIKTVNPGVYDIQFSAQIARSAGSGTEDILIWLRKNGTDISYTNTDVTLVGSTNDSTVAAWNWFVTSNTDDYYEVMWSATSTNVILKANAATSPAIPSVIVTVNRIDTFLSNTGSFSGSFTGNLIGTASWAQSASYYNETDPVFIAATASLATTGSNSFKGSQTITGSLLMSGSISVTGNISASSFTGSLLGTSSYAATASYAASSSYAATASSADNFFIRQILTVSGSLIITGSTIVSGSQTIIGSLSITGSQSLSGSLIITGSLKVSGSITGSLFGSSSYSTTASYAISSSYALSSSYAVTAAYAPNAGGVTGGGTNYIPLWTSATQLSSSVMYQSANNVGIGTTSPNYKLDIWPGVSLSSASGSKLLSQRIHGDTGNNDYLEITSTRVIDGPDWQSAGFRFQQRVDNTFMGYIQFNGGNNYGMSFGTGYSNISGSFVSESVRIVQSGYVGIGTKTPQTILDVKGRLSFTSASVSNIFAERNGNYHIIYSPTANPGIYIGNASDATNYYDNGAHNFRSAGGGTYYAVITTAGNVGIGTTSPYTTLTVGNSDATSEISPGGTNTHLTLKTVGAAGAIRFYTIGGTTGNLATTESMRVNAGGNVGIGTTSPTGKLHVSGGRIIIDDTLANQSAIQFNSSGTEMAVLYRPAAKNKEIRLYTAEGGDVMTWSGSSVGIGTTTPSYKLDVNGTFRSNAFWTDSGAISYWGSGVTPTAYGGLTWDTGYAQVYATAGNNLRLGANGANAHMFISSNGDVGIGTTPSSKLQITGSTSISVDGSGQDTSAYAPLGVTRANIASNLSYIGMTKTGVIPWGIGISSNHSLIVGVVTANTQVIAAPIMTWDYSTNRVGINTITPVGNLHVYDTNDPSSTLVGQVQIGGNNTVSNDIYLSIGTHKTGEYAFLNAAKGGVGSIPLALMGGNVGIGTTSPGVNKLYVNQTATWTGTEYTIFANGYSYFNGIRINGSEDIRQIIQTLDTKLSIATSGDREIIFVTNNSSERMRITGGGDVGIAQTAPLTKLHVSGNILSDVNDFAIYSGKKNTHLSQNAYFDGVNWKSYGSAASYGAGVLFQTDAINSRALNILVDTSISAANETLTFTGTPLLAIKTTGETGIGVSPGSTYKLEVAGSVGATAYYETSDITKKIVLETNPELVLNLDVIKFIRKDDTSNDVRYGYSAQQVRDCSSDLINPSGELSVKYVDIHTLKIASLEKRVSELEQIIKKLIG